MKILYIGDVMAEPGMELIERILPKLRQELGVDLAIAQSENVSKGKGIEVKDFLRLQAAGVDFCTGGNHSFFRDDIYTALNDPDEPIIRPANYPDGTVGLGYKYVQSPEGLVLVISLLGQVVGKDAALEMNNPLKVIDKILEDEKHVKRAATVVNFHGDFSSEKLIVGYYLDGRVTAVIGDHWHIQTNDGEVLPKGTAHITDVGMVGSLDSSLGVSFESLIPRWRDGKQTRNLIEEHGRMQFNGFLIDVDPKTGLCRSAKTIRRLF